MAHEPPIYRKVFGELGARIISTINRIREHEPDLPFSEDFSCKPEPNGMIVDVIYTITGEERNIPDGLMFRIADILFKADLIPEDYYIEKKGTYDVSLVLSLTEQEYKKFINGCTADLFGELEIPQYPKPQEVAEVDARPNSRGPESLTLTS